MNGFFLIALVVNTVPYVLGIQCFGCKIKNPTSLCDKTLSNTTNAANCSGIFDTCVTTALKIKSKVGYIEKTAYMMTCGQKSIGCAQIETNNCGPGSLRKYIDKIPGFEVTNCGVACCDSPMCNTRDIVTPNFTKSLGAITGAPAFVVSGIVFIMGLIL